MKDSIKYIILSTLIVMGLFLIVIGLEIKNNAYPKYSYTVNKDNSYEVLLNENKFYTSDTLPSGKYYVSKSINKFIMNFKYEFINDKNVDLDYKYNITADLVGVVNSNDLQKEVWNRKFNLTEDVMVTEIDTNNFSINQPINIDYQYFSDLVDSYEQSYNITINTTLKLYLNVAYNINSQNEIKDFVEVDIPVTNTVTNVEKKYQDRTNEKIYNEDFGFGISKIMCIVIGGILVASSIVIIVFLEVKNSRKPEAVVRKFLKNYDYLIVTVNNKPNIQNLQVLYIDDYKDLIDVAEQNKCNIIHFKEENKSTFYVIVDKCVYILRLMLWMNSKHIVYLK